MLRDGFPRRGGIRDGVEECLFSRVLLRGIGLDVARMMRPFDPGDCDTAGRVRVLKTDKNIKRPKTTKNQDEKR